MIKKTKQLDKSAQKTLLITIPYSHYCEKARWALDLAKIPYEEQGHAPLLHRLAVRYHRSGGPTVPILVTSKKVISDSTSILHYADSKLPMNQKLYFSLPNHSKEIEEWEDYFDEELGPHARRVISFYMLPDKKLYLRLMENTIPIWELNFVRLLHPLLKIIFSRFYQITPLKVEESKKNLRKVFDKVEAILKRGKKYLVGDCFSAADLAFASLTAPILLPIEYGVPLPKITEVTPEVKELVNEFRSRLAGQFALRLYREKRGESGFSRKE